MMRVIKYLFHAYKILGFYLLLGRGCSSFSEPWLGGWPSLWQPSVNKMSWKEDGVDETKKMVEASNWHELPKDILRLIFERLGLVDRIRFDLVCKGWRTDTTTTPQLVWLMLPRDKRYCQYLSFFDLCEGKVHKLKIPESAQGECFCGSSKGWLCFVKCSEIFLFDPISRVQIPLPPLWAMSDCENSFAAQQSKRNPAACIIDQVVVSSSDASQCIVAARIWYDRSIVVLCRPQDERWTIIEGLPADDKYVHKDILFTDDGKLYIMKKDHNLGAFQSKSITLLGGHEVNLKLIPYILPASLDRSVHAADANGKIWYSKERWVIPYLVESNGQILMVTKISDSILALDDDFIYRSIYYPTARFEVLKIQTTDDTMAVTRSSSLDNQSLFVRGGARQSIPAGNSTELDKNCIYFTEDVEYSYENEYPKFSRESGVFSLRDGSIKRSFPSVKTETVCYMSWFSLNIKVGAFN